MFPDHFNFAHFSDPYGLKKINTLIQFATTSKILAAAQNPFHDKGIPDWHKVLQQSISKTPVFAVDIVRQAQKTSELIAMQEKMNQIISGSSLAKLMTQTTALADSLAKIRGLNPMVMQYNELAKAFTNSVQVDIHAVPEDLAEEKMDEIVAEFKTAEQVLEEIRTVEFLTPKLANKIVRTLLSQKIKTYTGKVITGVLIQVLTELVLIAILSQGPNITINVNVGNKTIVNNNCPPKQAQVPVLSDTNFFDNNVVIINDTIGLYQKGDYKSKRICIIGPGTEISVLKRNKVWWVVSCIDASGNYIIGYIHSKQVPNTERSLD